MFATLSIVVSTAFRLHYALFFEHKKSPETAHVACATIILGSKIPELHPLYWFVGIWYFFKIAGSSLAMTHRAHCLGHVYKCRGRGVRFKNILFVASRSDKYIVSMQQTTCSALLRGFEPCSATESICT